MVRDNAKQLKFTPGQRGSRIDERGTAVCLSQLTDNRVIRILAGGHMVNLAGPRPMGNSIESMDLGFALQARCLEAVAFGRVGAVDCVVPVPRTIDEQVAEAFLMLHYASI